MLPVAIYLSCLGEWCRGSDTDQQPSQPQEPVPGRLKPLVWRLAKKRTAATTSGKSPNAALSARRLPIGMTSVAAEPIPFSVSRVVNAL